MNHDPGRKRRRLIGMGFVLAFALSTGTIIYTGLNVRAPGTADPAAREAPAESSAPVEETEDAEAETETETETETAAQP
jgi:hypothetical protein